jgi:hypothetical protein
VARGEVALLRFIVSDLVGQARGGAMMSGKSIVEATKAANDFCAQKGLNLQLRSTNTDGSARLIFRCLRTDDPEYKRPPIVGDVKP